MKKFIVALVAGLTLTGIPVRADNDLKAHQNLWAALEEVGVTPTLNDMRCFQGGIDGYYHSYGNALIVCQGKSKKPGNVAAWTTNDLDTLRHEAHHVIQDCVDGTIGDGKILPLFDDYDSWHSFVTTALTPAQIAGIIESYKGATPETHKTELEAFAVANSLDADMIALIVRDVCGAVQ